MALCKNIYLVRTLICNYYVESSIVLFTITSRGNKRSNEFLTFLLIRKKSPVKTKSGASSSTKYKSEEYIDSNEDNSTDDEKPKGNKEDSKSKTVNNTTRARSKTDEEMVSLGEESESEAELTDGGDESD